MRLSVTSIDSYTMGPMQSGSSQFLVPLLLEYFLDLVSITFVKVKKDQLYIR